MFCQHCGKQIPEDSRFCMYCNGSVFGAISSGFSDSQPEYISTLVCMYDGKILDKFKPFSGGWHNFSGFSLIFTLSDRDNLPTRSDGTANIEFVDMRPGGVKDRQWSTKTQYSFQVSIADFSEVFRQRQNPPRRETFLGCLLNSEEPTLHLPWHRASVPGYIKVILRFVLPNGNELYAENTVEE